MKPQIAAVVILAFAATCLAVPRNKRQTYDEARLSNEVIPVVVQETDKASQGVISPSEIQIDTTTENETTKKPELDDSPTSRPGNKRKKQNSSPASSDTFSRVIDDIFNIPISVLRAVNTLISNAFGTKQGTPASSAAVSPPVTE